MLFLKKLQQYFSGRGPLIHVVLDGWGVGATDETNAVNRANLPVMSRLIYVIVLTPSFGHMVNMLACRTKKIWVDQKLGT